MWEILNSHMKWEKKMPQRDTNKVSAWAKKDWEEAILNVYYDASRPGAPLTIEEAAIVVNRIGCEGISEADWREQGTDWETGKNASF